MGDQILVFGVLALALILFLWGRWRYDIVALGALLALTIPGVVRSEDAFAGFGHPAVVTVAAVLVISRALERAGLVAVVARWLGALGSRRAVLIPAITVMVALASGFMNNVGALALLMPVAIRIARDTEEAPSRFLMPLAFGSLLGGLLTLIGTPPNIIIGTFRSRAGGEAFRMFDFLPVGGVIALVGVVFIAVAGWRLVPVRRETSREGELFKIEDYLSELIVSEESSLVGAQLRTLARAGEDKELIVVGIVRDDERMLVPPAWEILRAGDLVIVETDPDTLAETMDEFDLELVGQSESGGASVDVDELSLMEAVVAPDARVAGRTAESLRLPWRHGVNLLAVSRRGESLRQRPSRVVLRSGDVLLLQGSEEAVAEALEALGCLPLAQRSLSLGQPRRVVLATVIFAIGLALTATSLLAVEVALTAAALAMVLFGLLRIREAYDAIDWPVIVLIAAMIPVGEALETTGGAEVITGHLERLGSVLAPVVMIGVLMGVVMALSNVVNNAAAAVVMAPIALGLAASNGSSADPFLMAVAVGASLPLLIPIGHQSNVLVMGPGGYRFGDYWRLGLPLSILVLVVGPPVILWAWPLSS